MPTRFAKEPRYSPPFCVPIDLELMEWMGGQPGVSWGEYQKITGRSDLGAFWTWLTGGYDKKRYYRVADSYRMTARNECYSLNGIQVHFCSHKMALGLCPDGSPAPIPDEWRQKLDDRK